MRKLPLVRIFLIVTFLVFGWYVNSVEPVIEVTIDGRANTASATQPIDPNGVYSRYLGDGYQPNTDPTYDPLFEYYPAIGDQDTAAPNCQPEEPFYDEEVGMYWDGKKVPGWDEL